MQNIYLNVLAIKGHSPFYHVLWMNITHMKMRKFQQNKTKNKNLQFHYNFKTTNNKSKSLNSKRNRLNRKKK